MLREALHYLTLGISVIPLKPNSKEPLLNWKEFQSRRAREDEVKGWFQTWKDVNIGIVTGSISGVCVVDLDGPEGLAEAKRLGLSSPLTTFGGKGEHLWFKHPASPISSVTNAVRIYPGIDLRGEGGYVVAPPSIHPNGRRYRFNRPLSASLVKSLPPFPVSIFAPVAEKFGTILGANQTTVIAPPRNPDGWIALALENMTNGNIDDTLFKVCSRLRNDGYRPEDALVLLGPHAERAGATEGHLQDKIDNVWGRYEPKPNNSSGLQSGSSLILHSPTNPDSLSQYAALQMGIDASERIGTGYSKFDAISKGLKKGEVCVIGARTGVGKSNFVITPIRTFCSAGKKVLLCSTEMSFDQVWARYIATLPKPESFKDHQFYVIDEFTPDIQRIEEALRTVMPDLLCFDHINHVGTDYHVVSKFMLSLKELARKFNIPVIVTAQLNRQADWVEQGEKVEPRLSMLQGSSTIEQAAALVLLLSEKRVTEGCTEIAGIIAKNRHGDRGMIQFGLFKTPFYHIREI